MRDPWTRAMVPEVVGFGLGGGGQREKNWDNDNSNNNKIETIKYEKTI